MRDLPARLAARFERHGGTALWLLLAAPVVAGALILHGREALVSAAGVPLLGVAVAVRERWPLVALAVPVALGLALDVELLAVPYWPALAAFAWLAGTRAAARPGLWFFAAVAVAGLPLCVLLSPDRLWGWSSLLLTLLIVVVLPWQLGRYRRRYAVLTRAGWRLADRMEREQRIVADRARIRERARIAGDMHDSLGHDLTLMAMRAAALQLDPTLDPRHQAVVAELREAAAEATERLRDIVGVLRTDDDETQPEPPFAPPESPSPLPEPPFASLESPSVLPERPSALGERPGDMNAPHPSHSSSEGARALDGRLSPGGGVRAADDGPSPDDGVHAASGALPPPTGVHAVGAHAVGARAFGTFLPPGERRSAADGPGPLVDRARAAGMAVTLERLDDLTGIPSMTALAVGRVVQEGLTNAAKHAPGAPVRVRVTREDDALRVSVANAPPAASAVNAVSGGAGLAGLDERVRLAGGTLRAGPVSGGGFEVVAELPTRANAAARPPTGGSLSTSARELARAEREVRRGLAQTVLVPLAVLTGILLLMVPVWLLSTSLSVLPRGTYDGLTVGAPRAEVEARLPALPGDGPPDGAPPAPAGQDCVYYTVRAFDDGAYRLCFAGDRLASKSVVGARR
ncbi:sensor histidine kinase [Nonomuraea roseoviolacea]|uniref:histidine kinase n=1 Tax=Nonomuraea roseoviolacea subsp. carminata TaxID=160689 RepID=A0ABT1JWK3_9ACTN|nr:histidine kinase [Nonomuraea roseoviolacea]MCP2345970.1 signal transduction histidine kinase [Nonomuraea roseoviolacea subsp. carminata]